PRPFRLSRAKFAVPDDIGRAVAYAAAKIDGRGLVLAFADSDDDCALKFVGRVRDAARRPDVPLCVVAAVREFASLFLAASRSLSASGHFKAPCNDDPDRIRDAAGEVSRLMAGGPYRKTVDAMRLSSVLSLDEAHSRCRWYRK